MHNFKCPKCKAKVPAYVGSRVFCSCGHQYVADNPSGDPVNTSPATVYNHWLSLHAYAPEHRSTWNEREAKQFAHNWLKGVPQQCCWKNFQPILHELGQDYSSPEAFAYKSWQWHDAVSEKLANPRITWRDCQASWWGVVQPQRPNLLITVATGRCLAELEIVRPSLEAYADKINADFIALTNTTEPWWGYEKFRVQRFVPQYERTLFVDCDVVISPDCENLFDIVPADRIGIHDDWQYLPSYKWMEREREVVCETQGWIVDPRETCLNTGVVVCSRHHRVWDRPKDGLPTTIHCAEQFAFEQQVFQQGVEWEPLPTTYNTQWWMENYGELVKDAKIDHLANSSNKIQDLQASIRRVNPAWSE